MSEVFRAAILADTHVGSYRSGPVIDGVNGRLLDIRDRLNEISKYIVTNGIPYVLILGDIFKEKSPNPLHLSIFAEFLSNLMVHDVLTVVFPGNHDTHKIYGQVHALKAFQYIRGKHLEIFDKETTVILGGQRFHILPYIKSPQRELLPALLKDSTKEDILLLHGTVEGAALKGMGDFELFDEDYIPLEMILHLRGVFAGHIHEHQHFNNVWYPGSIERLSFDDEGQDKFFLDVEVDRGDLNVKPIKLNARPMMTISADKLSAVSSGAMSVRDAVVRVVGVERQNVQEIRDLLTKKGCYFIASIQTMAREVHHTGSVSMNLNVGEFVKMFATKIGFKGDLAEAEKMMQQFIEAAPESYD